MKQQRDDHRFAEQMPIEVQVATPDGVTLVPAMTADLNPTGLGFRSTTRVEPGSAVSLALPLGTGSVTLTGDVRHVEAEQSHFGQVFMHGVAFGVLPLEVRDAIELHCTQHSMPIWRGKYRQSIDILTRAGEIMRNLRGQKRRLAGLPARLIANGAPMVPDAGMLILEEMSAGGARLVGVSPIAPGTAIHFEVPGAQVSGVGIVRHVQMLPSTTMALFSMGVELSKPSHVT
jgi:hypothetical protein